MFAANRALLAMQTTARNNTDKQSAGNATENITTTVDSTASSRLSEIIVAGKNPQGDLTFAMLAHLSHKYKSSQEQGRWLTWICPMNIGKAALEEFNFDVLGLRILHPKSEEQIPTLLQHALAAGTSHTVVAHCQGFSYKLYPWLENAASQGRCNGLIIRPQ